MAKKDKTVSEWDTATPVAEATTTAEATPKKARHAGVTTFVYIGPSLPNGRLMSNTILSGNFEAVTEYYKDAIEEYPSVEGLIVPLSQLADSKAKASKSGNGVYNRCQKVLGEIKAKGVEQ